jgi:hypothetical protein
MGKTTLTPGKLYARLSAEFARLRPREFASCQMPMVYVIERHLGDRANWLVDELPPGCEECQDVVNEIVSRFSFQYDIFDPTCTPVPAARAQPSRPFAQPRAH